MVWSTKVHATQLTSITTEQFFSSGISLGVGERSHVQLKGTFPVGAVDSLTAQVFATLDASGEQWDSGAFLSLNILPAGPIVSFVVDRFYKFRVSVYRNGSTDDIDADMWYRIATSL